MDGWGGLLAKIHFFWLRSSDPHQTSPSLMLCWCCWCGKYVVSFWFRFVVCIATKGSSLCSFRVCVVVSVQLVCVFVCFSQNHSFKILRFLLLLFMFLFASFKHPSFIIQYVWLCWWSYCYWCHWWFVVGAWWLVTIIVYLIYSCLLFECYCFCFLFWNTSFLLYAPATVTSFCNFRFWKIGEQKVVKK